MQKSKSSRSIKGKQTKKSKSPPRNAINRTFGEDSSMQIFENLDSQGNIDSKRTKNLDDGKSVFDNNNNMSQLNLLNN